MSTLALLSGCIPGVADVNADKPAAPGSLDTSFGGGGGSPPGTVVPPTILGGISENFSGLAFDSAGRIVAVGQTYDGSVQYAVIYRFNTNGSTDTTFGTGGYTAITNSGGGTYSDLARGVVIDSSDRILATGETIAPGFTVEQMTVYRLLTGGGLDTVNFNPPIGLMMATDAAGGGVNRDSGGGIALDAVGNILVTGSSRGPPGTAIEMAAWRVLPTGVLDTGFAGSGHVTDYFGISPGQNAGGIVLALSNTDVLVTGFANPNNACNYTPLWHYNNGGGLIENALVANPACGYGSSLMEEASGSIVVVGVANAPPSGNSAVAIYRYTLGPPAALDTTFAGTGYVYQPSTIAGSTAEWANNGMFDAQGRIVAVGVITVASENYATVWRYNSDGTLDTTFGGGTGYVTFIGTAGATTARNDQAIQVRLDSMGRYVIVGQSNDAGGIPRMVIWRVNS